MGIEEIQSFFETHFDAIKKYTTIVKDWVNIENKYSSSLLGIVGRLGELSNYSLK